MASNPIHGVADIDAIIALAKKYPVFPCGPDKSPRTERGFHAATQDPDTIRRWWRRWPDSLVGVPTGPITGLVVIDYDPDKAASATNSWIAENTELLCSTRNHRTARDGRHYLFSSKDRYITGTNLTLNGSLRRGLDLRGGGGYIIWWPLHIAQQTDAPIQPLPAGLIDERRFDRERELTPLPTATPEEWKRDRPRAVEALDHLDPDNGYEAWIRAGMAVHQASGGSDDGFSIWHDWSARGASYDGIEDCRYHWNSFGKQSGRSVTLGSLIASAKEAGYVPPPRGPELPPVSAYEDIPEANGRINPDPEDAADPEPEPEITLTAWEWIDPKTIPPREWVYGHHYMRGMVSATAGIGGAGKSSLAAVEAISMAIGRDLFRNGAPLLCGPQRVWFHNAEDPMVEMQRRFAAALQFYGVTPEDLDGRLYVTSGRDMPILLAQEINHGTIGVQQTTIAGAVSREITRRRIAVATFDPFVGLHMVNENDNAAMNAVMTLIRDIAHETHCAIDLIHHFRKLNGTEATADAMRGASSIVGACRSVRIVSQLTADEATKLGVNPEHRRRFIWLANAKANMLPPIDSRTYYELDGEALGNAKGDLEQDIVGVARHSDLAHVGTDLTEPEYRQVRTAIQQCTNPLDLAADIRAAGWIGKLVLTTLEMDPADLANKHAVSRLVAGWEGSGKLEKYAYKDPRQGRVRQVYRWIGGADEA